MKNTMSKKHFALSALSMCVALASHSALAATGYASENGGTTGGEGGEVVYATTGTAIHEALCNRASSDTPIIIQVEGTINHDNTTKVSGDSCNTAADRIELKEISNVTLIGVGDGALFDELGIHIRSSSNIIIQNVHVRNVKKSGSPTSNGGDAIGLESDVHNVWVDHVTLEASGGESDGYDALFDMKKDSKYVTLSYSILRNSGRGGLVGSSDSDDNNGPVTFHHNYYENINSRTPLLRHATAHAYNNYYNGLISSGMNPRIGGQIKAENNYFKDSKNPIGTFYTNDMGYWDVSGNVFDDVEWSDDASKMHPAGPDPVSTTSITIPYDYALDDADCVPEVILATAGAGTDLAVSDGTCSVTSEQTDSGTTDGESSTGDETSTGSESSTGSETSTSTDLGDNLALDASADGDGKYSGTSYSKVTDGDTTTYWSPKGTTGTINVKGLDVVFNTVKIIELAGTEGTVTSWTLVNHDTGATLAQGTTVPETITFDDVKPSKVSFVINSASDRPQIAEFEIYNQ